MYIEPSSSIAILKGIPWDNTYQHTPRWASRTDQSNYMRSRIKYTLSGYQYIREGRGWLKVQKNVEDLIGCNYLMFQNPDSSGRGGRTFYAFITAAEYVNTETTEIQYEIDVMQTWFLDCKLGQCFIERSHSATDVIGDNTVPEDVSIGDYMCDSVTTLTDGLDWSLCAITGGLMYNPSITTGDRWMETNLIVPVGGMPSMLHYNFFPLDTFSDTYIQPPYSQYVYEWREDVKALLDNHPDNVLALAIMPKFFWGGNKGEADVSGGTAEAKHKTVILNFDTSAAFQGKGDYIKNNKMFTFPYCCLELTNNQGDTVQYKYEYFDQTQGLAPMFYIMSDVSPDPSILVAPRFYAGMMTNLEHTIHLTDFPFIGFVSDVYKNWLAINKNQRAVAYDRSAYQVEMGLIKGSIGMLTSASRYNLGGTIQSGVQGFDTAQLAQYDIDAMMAKESDLQARGGKPIGGKGSTLLFANGLYRVDAKAVSLKWEQAKRIDDYFTVYGYAMRCTGTPNITSRKHWNYIKLANANIKPINDGVPADDVGAIVRILSNGITFWHNAYEIGDYSLDNSPK